MVDYGHRYILNLRDGEVYTRYYHRLDADSPNAVAQGKANKKDQYLADPAYYVPNGRNNGDIDPESRNPRYHIRGNGIRQWTPPLTAASLPAVAYSVAGLQAISPAGVEPSEADKPGEIIFKVEGTNVITSLKINAALVRQTVDDVAAITVSTDGGWSWKNVYPTPGPDTTTGTGPATRQTPVKLAFINVSAQPLFPSTETAQTPVKLNLVNKVNGSYDVLVRVQLQAKNKATDAQLKSIAFETITEVNAKTQPKLNLGKNTIYVGAGEQTESIVFTPDLRKGKFEQYAAEIRNLTSVTSADSGRYALLYIDDAASPKGWVDFKIDSPTDITSFTYGGRMCIRAPKSGVELSHSFDDGKTWIVSKEYFTTEAPWDNVNYQTVTDIPPHTRSVQFRYFLYSNEGTPAMCGLYSVRMEVQHKLADPTIGSGPATKPMEVTFAWKERQEDYTQLIPRSHTQLVDKLPFTYTIDVGGFDQPVMDSLTVNLKGARQAATRLSSTLRLRPEGRLVEVRHRAHRRDLRLQRFQKRSADRSGSADGSPTAKSSPPASPTPAPSPR